MRHKNGNNGHPRGTATASAPVGGNAFRLHRLWLWGVAMVCGTAAAQAATDSLYVNGVPQDSLADAPVHFSFFRPNEWAVRYTPGRVLAIDDFMKTWLKKKRTFSVAAEARWNLREKAADYLARRSPETKTTGGIETVPEWLAYASEYNFPTFTLGLRYNQNHGTTMHRDAKDWGETMEVDYTTHLGNVVTLYGRFDRPLWRTRRWSGGYYLGMGVGYSLTCYDRTRHIDNELIGTHFNIFFTTGLYTAVNVTDDVALEAGFDFAHHSNGALDRPNKGANYVGPFVGLKYTPGAKATSPLPSLKEQTAPQTKPGKNLFMEFTLGVGGKALTEVWQRTQYNTDPTDPDYRTDRFKRYVAVSAQTSLMYRYARRWASGLAFDVFYGSYAGKVREEESLKPEPLRVSPWSVGIGLKHEAFFGRLSARVCVGYYLFRHMGTMAKALESPYYERVGLFYTFSKRTGLSIGFNLNAYKTSADFAELQLSVPLRFGRTSAE